MSIERFAHQKEHRSTGQAPEERQSLEDIPRDTSSSAERADEGAPLWTKRPECVMLSGMGSIALRRRPLSPEDDPASECASGAFEEAV